MPTATDALNTQTLSLTLSGPDAIEAVAANLSGSAALGLAMHASPIDDAGEIDLDKAREVAAEDAGLVYATADVEWYGTDEESVALCGHLVVLVQSPDMRSGAPVVTIGGNLPRGAEPLNCSSVDPDMMEGVALALSEHLAAAIG